MIMAYLPFILGLLLVLLPSLGKLWAGCQSSLTKPRGCRRLGLPPKTPSNIADEYEYNTEGTIGLRDDGRSSTKERSPKNGNERSKIRVKALFAYPIKSCAGVELDTADVEVTGFKYDRLFCFAEDLSFKTSENVNSAAITEGDKQDQLGSQWEFRTLRNKDFSRLALIRPEIWIPGPAAENYHRELKEVRCGGVMIVYYPRVLPSNVLVRSIIQLAMTLGLCSPECSFRVPLHPPTETTYPSVPVKIWKDHPSAFDYGYHIPNSFYKFLSASSPTDRKGGNKSRITLLRSNPNSSRLIHRNAPRREQLGFQPRTGFADAYPIHLLNIGSVRDIAEKCAEDIPKLTLRRFRANIIVEGPAAYAEDVWKKVLLRPRRSKTAAATTTEDGRERRQGTVIHTVCHTVRCLLPNVDPDTGIRHASEPNKVLKTYRKIDPGDPKNACLGMQCVPAVEEFTISVGDELSVLETGEHFYIKMNAPDDPEV